MKRYLQLFLVVVTFLLVYISLNYYIISKFAYLFGFSKNTLFYIVLAISSFSYIIAMPLEKYVNNQISRFYYILSSIWMGVLTISFSLILVFDIVSLFLELPKLLSGQIISLMVLVISIYALINGNIIYKRNIVIRIKSLKKEYKIVQLSDIHLGTVNQGKFLEKVVRKTNEIKPDLVVITGDLVDGSAPITKKMADPINKIKAPIFYIIGNHEIYEGLDKIMPILEKTKMNILRNEVKSFNSLQIIGIDYSEESKHLEKTLSNMKYNKNKPTILLYHAPSVKADFLSKSKIELQLSGHTHGGQIWPFSLLVRLAFPYVSGLHSSKDGSSNVYVSEGTGTWGPPMRLMSNSEITIIQLKSSI